jgi:hypothetical protein
MSFAVQEMEDLLTRLFAAQRSPRDAAGELIIDLGVLNTLLGQGQTLVVGVAKCPCVLKLPFQPLMLLVHLRACVQVSCVLVCSWVCPLCV